MAPGKILFNYRLIFCCLLYNLKSINKITQRKILNSDKSFI